MTSATTHSLPSDLEELETLFTRTIEAATEGALTNDDRVILYRVAMAVAAAEFGRIEGVSGGIVRAEVLATLHHITQICDYQPPTNDSNEEDSGGSIPASS